jgi:hypothetical protein
MPECAIMTLKECLLMANRLIMTPVTESPSLENPCEKIQLKLVKTFIVSIQRVVLDAELLKFCSKVFCHEKGCEGLEMTTL